MNTSGGKALKVHYESKRKAAATWILRWGACSSVALGDNQLSTTDTAAVTCERCRGILKKEGKL